MKTWKLVSYLVFSFMLVLSLPSMIVIGFMLWNVLKGVSPYGVTREGICLIVDGTLIPVPFELSWVIGGCLIFFIFLLALVLTKVR